MECRISDKQMSIMDKLGILTDAAKYDAVSYTHLKPAGLQ